MDSPIAKGAAGLGLAYAGFKILDSKLALGHDLSFAVKMLPTLKGVETLCAKPEYSIVDVWLESMAKQPKKDFIIFENRRMTFMDAERTSNQMAHWLLGKGLQSGDTVALDMENKPEFVCWWLAAAKIGVKVALLNYNLKKKALSHSVNVSHSKGIICDVDTEAAVADIQGDLGAEVFYWGSKTPLHVKTEHTVNYDDLLGISSELPDKKHRAGIRFKDIFGYIYTSGTTGLPKAANIMHLKIYTMGASFAAIGGVNSKDVVYTCLPIYHSAGGGIGVMMSIITGATLCLSRKFSNSRFWREISENDCTVVQYIGELCRYLVNYAKANPDVYKIKHKLRMAVGNGLRPEVWDDFQDGFAIDQVAEFYGATEGNGALINLCHRSDKASRGAVGRAGALITKVQGFKIAKFDVENEEPVRGKDGRCVECAPGEAGELLMPILQGKSTTEFVGYTDEKATAKKLISDAFEKGDQYFRSGDLLRKDEKGYFFFVDRIGDTFRWKGENVSTMEVSEVVSEFPGIAEANVFGVKVPGVQDGRACLAAVTLQEGADIDFAAFKKHIADNLPTYARPLFLRYLPAEGGPSTGTFKQQKVALRDQGVDPSKVGGDPLHWLNPATGSYEPFTQALHEDLEAGKAKL
mmetsp:Transcript_16508/g.36472  ORF Transcript_16508/g.36472 Transcript_16508/m.36472 type:complete len:636 (+) Transcript_16508:47-1954(+)|eukprot:CAMPEP_0204400740 /NCGR_PEP_ID=MMETSP0470-20130426/4249_1 /ASSEMBLY_ACC=CAM_ASM_000385 /TAXON_ID=2969 /ORGANISM="Oxyrrhis marina" /LENGTH=635 /DNA_ID=CAMNT_0051395627 /DNA_START=39 /DNA_END=1946 /DNA_ORIENTATION=-